MWPLVVVLIVLVAFGLGVVFNPWFWLLLVLAFAVAAASRGSW